MGLHCSEQQLCVDATTFHLEALSSSDPILLNSPGFHKEICGHVIRLQSDRSREGNVPLRRASSPARGSPHNLPYAPRAGLPEAAGGRARPGPAPPGRGGAFRGSASAAVGARCGGGQHAEPAGARRGAGPLLHGDGAAAAPPRAHRLQGHGAGESAPPGAAPPPPGPQPRPAARSQAAAAALPFAFPGRLEGRRAGIVVQGPLSAGLRGLGPLPCDGAGCLSPPSSH